MNRSFGGSLDCNSMNYNKGKSFRFSEWNSSTLYSNDDYIQDFVSYMGSMYACIQTNTATEPTNTLYWKLVVSGQPGKQGKQGNTGVTFTPHVDEQGNLSWTNDGGLENPKTVNIKGPKGENSTVPGPKGEKGDDGVGLMGPQGRPGLQGIGLDFNWDGTKLGIKRTIDEEYTYVDLKGDTGSRGTRGLQGIQGPEGKVGPRGNSLYIQVSDPNEFGQRFLQKRYNENEAWVSFFDLSQMKGPKGDSIIIERNLDTGNIEYRYQNQPSSANKILIYKDDIKGPKGDTIAKSYVADDGYLYIQLSGEDIPRRVGYVKGERGDDGREIILRVYSGPSEDPNDPRIGTHLQWKYAGDDYKLWTNLIQINDLMNVALAGLKLEYKTITEPNEVGIETKYEVTELSHYQVEFDENNNLVLTEKIANLSSVKVPTKTLLKNINYDYDHNKLIFVFDTATGDETIEIDCDPFIRQGNGITISNGNIINVDVADESEKLADDSDILVVDELGLRVRGLKDKLIKEFNLIKTNRDNDTHYYSYEYIAQDGTVYPIQIPDFVEWSNNPDETRQIELRNNDKLVGFDIDDIIRNLISIDGTDTVQVGDSRVYLNLNGKESNPTYNQQKLALISNLEDEISGLHLIKEDTPSDPDIAARYYLADKDGVLLGDVHIDILKDNYLKDVTYNEDTYTFNFDFWVNDDPEKPAHSKVITITLQKLFDDLKAIINEINTEISEEINNLETKHTEDVKFLNETIATVNQNLVDSVNTINKNMADGFNTINGGINNEIRPAIQENTKKITELREDLDEEIARRDEIQQGLDNLVDKTDKLNQDLLDTNSNLAAEIIRATTAESEIYDHIHELEENVVTSEELDKKEDAFTVGVGLEMTSDRVLNVTLDTTVFKVFSTLPDQPLPEDMQKIHLVPSDVTGSQNIYKEYIWANNAWELLGEYQSKVDLTSYLTKSEAQETYQPIGDYALKSDISNLATKDEIPDISNLALKSEIPTKVSELENDSNFLTSIPSEYVTESELDSKGYLTTIPDNYVIDTELQEAISGVRFELPIATDSILGGIKVGSGLSIDSDTGVLSATGGGTADAVEWDNVLNKPDWVTENKPVYNYTEIEGNIPVGKLPIATTESVGVVKVGAGLTIDGSGVLSATGGGTADAVDWANVTNKPQINGHELIGGNNTLDSLGIQPAGDYALKSEIPNLSSYATQSWVQEQGYLTSIPDNYITDEELNDKGYLTQVPDEYITETELNEKGYLTQIPEEYVTETELTEAINGAKYTLPTASTDTLGGIKVGAGLSSTGDGILSATGGGVADSVAWENVVGRPTNLSQFTNDSGFITSDDLPDLSDYALKSEIPDISDLATKTEVAAKQDKLVSGTNIKTINGTSLLGSGNIVIEASGGSGIIDVSDEKTYGRTKGSWVDLTDWLKWAEYD